MPRGVVTDWLAPSVEVWQHDDVPWEVELRWSDVDGYAECVGLQIAPKEDGHVLRAATVRALPFGKLVRDARRARYEEHGGSFVEALTGTGRELEIGDTATPVEPWKSQAQRRRPQLDDGHYADVARIYSNAVARGAAPRKAVAASMHASDPTAARWISEARNRGLLPPTVPGKARGAVPSVEEEK